MPKRSGVPAVWVRGLELVGDGALRDTLRAPEQDLFR
jgi:hypothetical protein